MSINVEPFDCDSILNGSNALSSTFYGWASAAAGTTVSRGPSSERASWVFLRRANVSRVGRAAFPCLPHLGAPSVPHQRPRATAVLSFRVFLVVPVFCCRSLLSYSLTRCGGHGPLPALRGRRSSALPLPSSCKLAATPTCRRIRAPGCLGSQARRRSSQTHRNRGTQV